jgi:hypothetical protein
MSKGFRGPVTVPASTIDSSRSIRLADVGLGVKCERFRYGNVEAR